MHDFFRTKTHIKVDSIIIADPVLKNESSTRFALNDPTDTDVGRLL